MFSRHDAADNETRHTYVSAPREDSDEDDARRQATQEPRRTVRSNEFVSETACQKVDFSRPPRTNQWIDDLRHSTSSIFCATPTKKRDMCVMTKSGVWDYIFSTSLLHRSCTSSHHANSRTSYMFEINLMSNNSPWYLPPAPLTSSILPHCCVLAHVGSEDAVTALTEAPPAAPPAHLQGRPTRPPRMPRRR